MSIQANIAFCKNAFIAVLSDGRRIEQPDFRDMAYALHCAGVRADHIQYDWQAGQRMITAGQQVALRAEMRRLENDGGSLSFAA